MDEKALTPLTVAGPSHVISLRHAIATGQVATPRRPVRWHETGGVSALSPYFRRAAFATTGTDALFLVPDFRIGNRLLADPDDEAAYGGIARELISPENDARILAATLDALQEVRKRNPRCRFLFWSLAGRERLNRAHGRYVTDGVYRHPTWNLADVEELFGDRTVSLRGVVGHPRASMLHVDDGGHPSWFGHELLRRVVDRPDDDPGEVLDAVLETTPRPVVDFAAPTLLSGASAWIATLHDYVARGIVRLGENVVVRSREELFGAPLPAVERAYYLSHLGGAELPTAVEVGHLRQLLDDLRSGGLDVRTFLWDYRARHLTERSRERPPAGHPLSIETIEGGLARYALPGTLDAVRAADVEKIAPDPQPSLSGVLSLVRLLGGSWTLELV